MSGDESTRAMRGLEADTFERARGNQRANTNEMRVRVSATYNPRKEPMRQSRGARGNVAAAISSVLAEKAECAFDHRAVYIYIGP